MVRAAAECWALCIALSIASCKSTRRADLRGRPPPPAEAHAREPNTIRLALGGDTMLARLVTEAILARGPRYVWGDALPLLREADLALVNLECVIAEGGQPFRPPRVFSFRAHPKAIDALVAAGIDYVSIANNHALDYGGEALLEMIRRLDGAGIAHAGAGRNLAEAEQFAMLERRGTRVAIVAFADHYREYASGPSRPGTNVVAVARGGPDFARVRRALDSARAAGAHLVVFSIHWGPNMREVPTPGFVEFARAVLDAGADVFHGHSAHVFQGIEIYRGKPILYDTGDLVDDYAVDEALRNDRQVLFLVEATARGARAIELVPLRISRMQVNLAHGSDLEAIHERMRRLSRAMATELKRCGDRLCLRLREGAK